VHLADLHDTRNVNALLVGKAERYSINTVKLVQGGIARDRIYFPNWAIFRIIQNCKKKKQLKIN
jgi:hypothetical protein